MKRPPMPAEVATIIAEMADYAGALMRLQSRFLIEYDPERGETNYAINGGDPSIRDCGCVGELVSRLLFDIEELSRLHELVGKDWQRWRQERPYNYTACALAQTQARSRPPA